MDHIFLGGVLKRDIHFVRLFVDSDYESALKPALCPHNFHMSRAIPRIEIVLSLPIYWPLRAEHPKTPITKRLRWLTCEREWYKFLVMLRACRWVPSRKDPKRCIIQHYVHPTVNSSNPGVRVKSVTPIWLAHYGRRTDSRYISLSSTRSINRLSSSESVWYTPTSRFVASMTLEYRNQFPRSFRSSNSGNFLL